MQEIKGNAVVEILLATYNGEKFIREQLDSILSQDYEEWVIRACDDASTDGTYGILKEYQEKFPDKFLVQKNEKGFGSAKLNFMHLIEQSTGEYVMCCDQDDVWLPNKISVTLQKMKSCEEKDVPILVHTDLKVVDCELQVISESFFEHSNLRKTFGYRDVLIQNHVTGCTMMMNRRLVQLMNKTTRYEDILMHDWLAALVATGMGKVAFVNEATMLYRQHTVNSVGAKRYGFGLFVSKLKNNSIKKSLIDTTRQAREAANTYKNELPVELHRLTDEFAKLFDKGKWYRMKFYIKEKVWKKGLPRQVWQLFFG